MNWNSFVDFLKRDNDKIKDSYKTKDPNNIRRVLAGISKLTLVVTICLLFCVLVFFPNNKSFALFNILAIVFAYLLGGGAVGFIFAIPKSAQRTSAPVLPAPSDTTGSNTSGNRHNAESYTDNTNLEEISDWLTKIIIGLSLTQFNELLRMLHSTALQISRALSSGYGIKPDVDFYSFSYALILCYGVAGLIIGYLWTRIDFRKILVQNRKEVEKIEKLEEQNKNLVNAIKNQETVPQVKHSPESRDADIITKVNEIEKGKLIKDKSDTQKGRWGSSNIAHGKQLIAEVNTSRIPGLYIVKIKFETIDHSPLDGPVAILLDRTFKPMIRVLEPQGGSEVFIEVIAYEAFTIGALSNVKSTTDYESYELDLNKVPGFPEGFYWK